MRPLSPWLALLFLSSCVHEVGTRVFMGAPRLSTSSAEPDTRHFRVSVTPLVLDTFTFELTRFVGVRESLRKTLVALVKDRGCVDLGCDEFVVTRLECVNFAKADGTAETRVRVELALVSPAGAQTKRAIEVTVPPGAGEAWFLGFLERVTDLAFSLALGPQAERLAVEPK